MTQSNWRLLALAGATWLLAGCINVQPADGVYSCGNDVDCPNNFYCDPTVHTCWKKGDRPIPKPTAQHDMSGSVDMGMDGGGDTQQCHDGVRNGSETDVDCGGSCEPCQPGQMCLVPHDCASMICNETTKLCVASKCENGIKDPGETDVDCGGTMCLPCGNGKGCNGNADCSSGICNTSNMTCAGSLCMDGMRDGMESDVDCGGPKCSPCLGGKKCGVDSDCQSNVCNVSTHTCAKSLCENGVKDPGETDIDCGGNCPTGCGLSQACKVNTDCASMYCNVKNLTCVADACHDGVKETGETDIDCGGQCGNTCKVGQMCKVGNDCASGTCGANGTCSSGQCSDGSRDGMETDIDCGGGTCGTCALGKGCSDGTRDCMSTFCNAGKNMCVDSQCKDGLENGSETDVDCGGPTCGKCATGAGCKAAADCSPPWCANDTHKCVATSCTDKVQDNGESDVDCGGTGNGCPKCDVGKGCGTTDANCLSGFCNYTNSLCAAGQCSDGRQDVNETDVDCGGATCGATCAFGKKCNVNGDCGSGACDYLNAQHTCTSSTCGDHHLDGDETDVDCGGSCGSNCAIGKTCKLNTDCAIGFCDPTSHTCACGGVMQACCPNAQCTQASDLCTGSISCNSSNRCVAGNPVTCPTATQCTTVAACNPQTGTCPVSDKTGSCDNSATDQCLVPNSSTCSSGQCTGGTHVGDRCNAGNTGIETCNNNTWTLKTSCPNGCANNKCTVPTPTVTATVLGSDVSVSWTAVASGVTCTLYRNDNGGADAQPAAIISPCPAGVQGACNAYDRFLLRGSYTYKLKCVDGSGNSATSASSSAVSPGPELCIANRGTSLEVHTAGASSTADRKERVLSSGTGLSFSYGVAYLPAPSGHTNCAWGDTGCGTVYVTNLENDQVMSFDGRASDGGSEVPQTHEQILTLQLKDTTNTVIGSPYQPIGAGVLGNELIVAMGSGFIAGYPAGFPTSTPQADWYVQATASNKLGTPEALAVDNGGGTFDGQGDVYVAGATDSTGTKGIVNGYHLSKLNTGINSISHANGSVTPFVTITSPTLTIVPSAIAVDQVNHIVYVATSSGSGLVYKFQITNPTATSATVTPAGTVALSGSTSPTGLAFISDAHTPATLFVLDYTNGLIESYVNGALTFNLAAGLTQTTGGIVVCN